MKTQLLGIAVMTLGLLLQPGCGTFRSGHEARKDSIISNELVKSTKSWDGRSLPGYPPGQPEITIRRIIIPAGTRLDTHHHPVINAGYLTKGELTVVSEEGKTLHLKAGDPIIELVDTLHYGINQGKGPAEIVVFYAGTVGNPTTVLERP
jgi:quercetin dioxygenase-like cupin family protein